MQFQDVVRRRRMVRSYEPGRPVPHEMVVRALENARRAPSAGFSQGRDFVVLRSDGDRARFWQASTPPEQASPWLAGMRSAPVLVVVLSDPQRYLDRYAEPDKGWVDRDPGRWPVPYWDLDAGMAALLMLLTAVDEGLSGCFFGVPGPRHGAVLAELGAPPGRRIVGVVSLGYRAPDRRSPSLRRGRRPFDDVVHEGRFGTPLAQR